MQTERQTDDQTDKMKLVVTFCKCSACYLYINTHKSQQCYNMIIRTTNVPSCSVKYTIYFYYETG